MTQKTTHIVDEILAEGRSLIESNTSSMAHKLDGAVSAHSEMADGFADNSSMQTEAVQLVEALVDSIVSSSSVLNVGATDNRSGLVLEDTAIITEMAMIPSFASNEVLVEGCFASFGHNNARLVRTMLSERPQQLPSDC